MLKIISLKNKPLCLESIGQHLYIGDAHGVLYKIESPFLYLRQLLIAPAPISAIQLFNGEIYYGTWDGTVHYGKNSKKFGNDPIKCMAIYKDKLFISVDKSLIISDFSLNCIEKYDTKYKILCMDVYNDKLYFGMATGLISMYDDKLYSPTQTEHTNNILAIKDGMTGSVDGTLRKQDKIIFSGNKWIRCIFNENLFSAGTDLYLNQNKLYSHEDEITGIAKIDNTIITIGLDYCYKIYQESISITHDDEEEIMNILNS